MLPSRIDVIIVGAGLSGLTLAYRLRNSGKSVLILEARERLGGRIETLYTPGTAPLEMGATWLGRKHTALWKLLKENGLEVFPQRQGEYAVYEADARRPAQFVRLPPNPEPSYRIRGGSSVLIESLAEAVGHDRIRLNQAVRRLTNTSEGVAITTDARSYLAETAVLTLPPELLVRTLDIDPPLPEDVGQLAVRTDTWMGQSIKFALTYPRPFWREEGSSGTFFSNAGPVVEMYDHADASDEHYALKGFVDPELYALSGSARQEAVLKQLEKAYGASVRNFTSYVDRTWRGEKNTSSPLADRLVPHQNQGHPAYRLPYWNGRLLMAGTETAAEFAGYMEGAVRGAERVARYIRSASSPRT
ncbi:FAD-dependent oxidoreductase [Lewinella sp. JB7]|uniref:flavin monoamine oxidase family protein n=1 Tax=Lewinella sp. JB7 TaxID=2962887 RepID=UPI0020C9FD34|nr:FAD-dependent oxidoreductase [Lewinella sp. JB7]MCP9235700.1 FAD-dependent oxidoreductase [Lewinella sp. JB7]